MLQKSQMTEMEHDGVDKYWITLKEALPVDSGTFTCMAENIAGRSISGAELRVIEGMNLFDFLDLLGYQLQYTNYF